MLNRTLNQMKYLNEIIEAIQGFIKEYNDLKGSNNISAMLEVKDKICGWSFRFAELTADIKEDYNNRYFIRRIATSKTKNALIRNGSKIGTADTEAIIEHEADYKSEQQAEALAYKADLMLRQTNIIIRAIEQKVSYLKWELTRNN